MEELDTAESVVDADQLQVAARSQLNSGKAEESTVDFVSRHQAEV